jgi:hypothetical protein
LGLAAGPARRLPAQAVYRVRPLSPGDPAGPSTVLDSQTWLRRVRKVRIRVAVFATGSAPDISVRTLAPGHGSGLLSLKSSSWFLRRCSLTPFECLPILRSGTTAPLRAGAEGVVSRIRLFRVFDARHFMRAFRQLPSCLALPPRSLFFPMCGGGQPPLGHRVLLSACTSANGLCPVAFRVAGGASLRTVWGGDQPDSFPPSDGERGLGPRWFAVTTVGPLLFRRPQ